MSNRMNVIIRRMTLKAKDGTIQVVLNLISGAVVSGSIQDCDPKINTVQVRDREGHEHYVDMGSVIAMKVVARGLPRRPDADEEEVMQALG